MSPKELALGGPQSFDRSAHLRRNEPWLAQMQASNKSQFLLFWRGKLLSRCIDATLQAARLTASDLSHFNHSELVFLGKDREPVFAAELLDFDPEIEGGAEIGGFSDHSAQPFPQIPGSAFFDLRNNLTALKRVDLELAGTAHALMAWHRSHQYCANCGHRSEMKDAGWKRICPACGKEHFPRTDPVCIMLITYGDDVLLARSLGWPEKLWSLPAGFIEPGETVEAAVRRETHEETGIDVGAVELLMSQSWPFPASLMIGCKATALSKNIQIDPTEIDDAAWVSRKDMLRVLDGDTSERLPPRRGAIARHILERWVEGHFSSTP